jgi:hypothetical protein
MEGGGAPHVKACENASAPGEGEPALIAPRLQTAVARVLPAIEATVARLSAQPTHPREMERAARALASLTRTLRELNTLLSQCPMPVAEDNEPEDADEFRRKLAYRIEAFVRSRTGGAGEVVAPQETQGEVGCASQGRSMLRPCATASEEEISRPSSTATPATAGSE